MNNQERNTQLQEKLAKLMQDEAFIESLLQLKDPKRVQAAFAGKDAKLTLEEVKTLGRMLERAAGNGGDLTEEDMQEVAGGTAAGGFTYPVLPSAFISPRDIRIFNDV